MFDPLFALAFLLIVTLPIGIIVFWVMKNRLHKGAALLMALVVPVAFVIGCSGGMKLNYVLDPVRFVDESPLVRLIVTVASGLILAWIAGALVWRLSPKSKGNADSRRDGYAS